MRVLPILLTAERQRYMRDVVLPVFRAAAVAWVAGKYPAHEMELAAAADACAAHAAAAAPAAADAYGAACAADAAYAAFAADAAYAADAAAYAAAAHADAANGAHADAAYAAATAALAVRGDAAHAVDATAFGFGHFFSAASAARAVSAAAAARAAGSFFWSALSADATRLEEGAAASDIAGAPLWPNGQPVRLRSLWKVLEAGLAAEKQDWQVWTSWYDERLGGRVREEKRELAYVRIGNHLWDQGPAIVNAEIKRRV
ncbi:MAG: hypothetical protein ACREDT_03745 [Methylocella sp.]